MALYEGFNDTPIPDICMPKETKISESDMSTYITGYNDNVDNQLQFSSIANSLTQSRGTFPENISYKIEGNALTWIARGHQNDFTIQCTNALEIVDGFFRAEYFLDTSRILDNHGELQSLYHTEVPSISYKPRQLVSQQTIVRTVRKMKEIAAAKEELLTEERLALEELGYSASEIEAEQKQYRDKLMKEKVPGKSKDDDVTPIKTDECIRVMNITQGRADEKFPVVEPLKKSKRDDGRKQFFATIDYSSVIKKDIRLLTSDGSTVKRKRSVKPAEELQKYAIPTKKQKRRRSNITVINVVSKSKRKERDVSPTEDEEWIPNSGKKSRKMAF